MLRYPRRRAAEPIVLTWERRVDAGVDAVWAAVSDPYTLSHAERNVRVVSTDGEPGQVGSRTFLKHRGNPVPMERAVAEASVGERLVFNDVSYGRVIAIHQCQLQADGDATVLTWTYIEPPFLHPLVHRVSAMSVRFGIPRWLARVEREIMKTAEMGP